MISLRCHNERDSDGIFLEGLVLRQIHWNVIFSYPGRDVDSIRQNGVRQKILDILGDTREELHIYIYGLTDERILDEILRAMNRGVRVRIVADRDRDYSGLVSRGIPYEIWRGGGLHHPKLILSDRRIVFTGTGNFTTQGLLKDFDSYFYAEIHNPKDAQNLLQVLSEEGQPFLSLGDMLFLDSPRSGVHIQNWILDSIRNSKRSIRYMIYSHFDPVISWELIRAAMRGVRVEGIYNRPIDPEGVRLSRILPLYGSEIRMDENEDRFDNGRFGLGGLLHHKTMILDEKTLLTGSYNYSRSARDFNRELFQITENPRLVREHLEEFERVRLRSSPFRDESDDSQPISDSVTYREWGRGIFQSVALERGIGEMTSTLPISSGVFSFSSSSRRNLPLNGEGILSELGMKINWKKTEILTWNNRVPGGVEFRIEGDGDWGQVVFWTSSGGFFAVPLERIARGVYYAGLGDVLSSQTTGFLFLRNRSGEWDSVGCYLLGERNQPGLYRYYLLESIFRGLRLGVNTIYQEGWESCSRLGRSGDSWIGLRN